MNLWRIFENEEWILPVFDRQFGWHQVIVIFRKTPQISTVAKLRILLTESRVKSLLTWKISFKKLASFF